MLEILFGNKTVKKILLFLFVNGKCYGAELQRTFKTALTPFQKALMRLEKGGIIISYLEGKTRVYLYNPSFPLLHELEQLLKKAYTLLPADGKKEYYVVKFSGNNGVANRGRIIEEFWQKLLRVQTLKFKAKTKSKNSLGWDGVGSGQVIITKENGHTIISNEKGSWKNKNDEEINFTNVFRWTLDKDKNLIGLEHLRQGIERPVFLFHLEPSSEKLLSSVESHLCGADTYFGQIHFDQNSIRFNWRVIGPKKNEDITYYYSF
jgi:hypothetical protein